MRKGYIAFLHAVLASDVCLVRKENEENPEVCCDIASSSNKPRQVCFINECFRSNVADPSWGDEVCCNTTESPTGTSRCWDASFEFQDCCFDYNATQECSKHILDEAHRILAPETPLHEYWNMKNYRKIWRAKHSSPACLNAYVMYTFYGFTKVPFEISSDFLFKADKPVPSPGRNYNFFLRATRQGLRTFPQINLFDFITDRSGVHALWMMNNFWKKMKNYWFSNARHRTIRKTPQGWNLDEKIAFEELMFWERRNLPTPTEVTSRVIEDFPPSQYPEAIASAYIIRARGDVENAIQIAKTESGKKKKINKYVSGAKMRLERASLLFQKIKFHQLFMTVWPV